MTEFSEEESKKLMYLILLGVTYEYSKSFTDRFKDAYDKENIYYWEFPENWKGRQPIVASTNEIYRIINNEKNE